MSSEHSSAPRRYYFDAYALTYTDRGWALLHKDHGIVGTDQHPEELEAEYQDGKTLRQFVLEAIEQGLGETL